MPRQTVAISLPADERGPVERELSAAGYDPAVVGTPDDLAGLFAARRDVSVAILDGETDFDQLLEYYGVLHEEGRRVPALMVISPRTLHGLSGAPSATTTDDEYFTRPYSAESLRWRIEAMLIRAHTVDDGSGPIIESAEFGAAGWTKRATVVAVFNPKGGVGKTTISINLAAALQVRHGQRVLLVDADTVTGHIANSLGLEDVRTVVDAWTDDLQEGLDPRPLAQLATQHPSGLDVVVMSSSPLDVAPLEPRRVADAIALGRRGYDFMVIDMHPSYSGINKAVFERADRILVPITPDVPALRAGVQLNELAADLGIRDRLAMVVNRANSGVSVADMERTVGMPALALIRSGGLLFVRAANVGRTVVEQYPREKVTEDFDALADRLLGIERQPGEVSVPAGRTAFRLFGRVKEPVRA